MAKSIEEKVEEHFKTLLDELLHKKANVLAVQGRVFMASTL